MHSIAWWPTLIVVAVATFTDLRSRRIPNWLVLPFLLAGIVVSAALHGWPGIGHSLEGMALGGLLFGVLCWMGGMGMGDVKLCAAIGAWIGPSQLLFALVITGIAGGMMALVLGRRRRISRRVVPGHGRSVSGFCKRGLASSSGTGSQQSNDTQNALCSGYRDRNHCLFLFSLRTETRTM